MVDVGAGTGKFTGLLTPICGLALVWNLRHLTTPWLKEVADLIECYCHGTPTHYAGRWRAALEDSTRFAGTQERVFRNDRLATPDEVADRHLSISSIAALPDVERSRVADRIRAILDVDPETSGREAVVVPHHTLVVTSMAIAADQGASATMA